MVAEPLEPARVHFWALQRPGEPRAELKPVRILVGALFEAAPLRGARALVKLEMPDIADNPDAIVAQFRARYYDTQKFFDPFAGGKFAQYLFRAHADRGKRATREEAHQLIEEATLFVDAAHQCYTRLGSALRAAAPATPAVD